MIGYAVRFAGVFFIIVCLGAAAFSQVMPLSPQAVNEMNMEMNRAQELEKQGKHEEAKKIYERLYETIKTDNVFWRLLLSYERTGAFDDMERLIRERLDKFPNDPSMQRYLARVYYSRGDNEKGKQILYDIIEGHWEDIGRAYLVTNELSRQNDLDSVIEIFERVRELTGNTKLFAPSLANIYAARMDYIKAIEEYLKQLDEVKTAYSQVETTIHRALESGKSTIEVERPLRDYLNANPGSLPAARLLSGLLYDAGDYDGAFEVLVPAAVASVSPNDLRDLGSRYRNDGLDEYALRTYEAYYRYFKDDPWRIAALLEAASLKAETGDVQGALELYRRLAADNKGTREGDIAVLKQLELSRSISGFTEFARTMKDFASSTVHTDVAREAWMILGRAYLRHSLAEEAAGVFEQARLKSRSNREKYETSVEEATLHFFTGNYEAMSREIENAIRYNAAGTEANDLMQLKILGMMGSSGTDAKGLELLAGGKYALYRGETSDARARLAEAAEDTSSVIAPYAALELGKLCESLGDHENAVMWYLKSSELTSDPTLSAGATLAAADVLSHIPAERERSVKLYRKALTAHPGNVHESEIRRKLMNLVEK